MATQVRCPSCGATNYVTDRACMSCGAKLGGQTAPAVPPPTSGPAVKPPVAGPRARSNLAPLPPNIDMPVYLYVLACLPIGIPILTLGGAIWGAMGGGLAALNISIGRMSSLPLAARISIIFVSLTILGYVIVFATAVTIVSRMRAG